MDAQDRQAALDAAIEDVLLAREQARLGLIEEAEAAWNRAVALLVPLASSDAELRARVREIEAERDQALRDAELRAEAVEAEADADATEAAPIVLLDEGEPPLDTALLPEVQPAVDEVQTDYPVVKNDRVLAWVEQWSRGLRNYFAGSIERSGMYIDRFRRIFAEEGVPQDLVYLAHVESGFKTSAYSRAAARGIFQFIAATGKRYGLATDWWLDERADPEKSCRASASYLRDLYAEFGDWYLALAAYNAGEGKVRDVIARTGNRDFFHPGNQKLFRLETRNYVPAILAATIIAKNPAKFGFGDVVPKEPEPYDTVVVTTPTSLSILAESAQTDTDTLRRLNPALRRGSTPPSVKEFVLKIPVAGKEGFEERLAQIPADKRIVRQNHTVARGETLAKIARRYGVSSRALAQANGLGRKPRLSAGMVLVVPDGPDRFAVDQDQARRGRGKGASPDGWYTVRRGDHLAGVAKKFGVSTKQLRAWNRLGAKGVLKAGQKLRIEAPEPRVASSKGKGNAAKTPAVAANGAPKSTTKTAATTTAAATTAKAGGTRSHVVRKGETLWRISQKYGVRVEEIIAANGLRKNAKINAGQRLIIPGRMASLRGDDGTGPARALEPATASPAQAGAVRAKVHVVRSGETIPGIARRYGTTVETICQLNGLAPDAALEPGATLSLR